MYDIYKKVLQYIILFYIINNVSSKRKENEMNRYKIKFVYIANQYNAKTTITEVIETKKEITKEYIESYLNPDIKKGIKEIIEIKIKKLS